MPEPSEPEPDVTADDSESFEPLPEWARAFAGVIGIALISSGSVAVFTTENQAGCATLILIGAVFLSMLLSGNPLHSLGHGETQVKFASARRKDALDDIREEPPEVANRALEVLTTVDPGARRDPWVIALSAQVYERLIEQRIRALLPTAAVQHPVYDDGFDLGLRLPGDKYVGVVIKFRSNQRLILAKDVQQCIGIAAADRRVILVANRPLTQPARTAIEEARAAGVSVDFVFWRHEQDDEVLRSALSRMADQ
ncbi:hypothetical protein [Streptomyces sp. H39-S7]|uniref:hypothetical protein n=1 Tax=Streptomyces sp. H39-S7 TaxID=3004357 RepID=UPI0022AFD066|nr:hypothetical protein [Streptomyces sp. H39-S7]MCZ4124690.1 hypothetical protein [Streptomyces sp. H39-S7]